MLRDAFALVGIVFTTCALLFFFWLCYEAIREAIVKAIWTYKYRHRFEKKAIAKCYCRDCVYKTSYKTCIHLGNNIVVRDDFFCKTATPHKRDPELKEKNNA
jgi:hypothetical protein